MRIPYYCPYCDQRSTRRWNLEVHIKRKHGGYLLGKSSGRYIDNNPPLYSNSNPLVHATVADSHGDIFQPRYIPQQVPLGTLQYSASPIYPPWQIIDHQSYGTSLSDTTTTKLKIEELKRLVYKYSQYHNNDPDEIVRLVVYNCINGDNTLLNNKLEQLRTIDRTMAGLERE